MKKKKIQWKRQIVNTPIANNEGDSFCTGFLKFSLFNYEFNNKSLAFAHLFRKKKIKKNDFTRRGM